MHRDRPGAASSLQSRHSPHSARCTLISFALSAPVFILAPMPRHRCPSCDFADTVTLTPGRLISSTPIQDRRYWRRRLLLALAARTRHQKP